MILLLGWALAGGEEPLRRWDFSSEDGGFVASSGLHWERGALSGTGPEACWSSERCWATKVDGHYLNDAWDALEFPSEELSSWDQLSLRWWEWREIRSEDWGRVEVEREGAWEERSPRYIDGLDASAGQGQWRETFLDLSELEDLSQLRFAFQSSESKQAPGWYVDAVELWAGDVIPPTLRDLTVLEATEDWEGPYPISVYAWDEQPLEVQLRLRLDSGDSEVLPMRCDGAGSCEVEIPGQPPDTLVQYRVEASDGQNSASLPVEGWESFRVRLPEPQDLWMRPAARSGSRVVLRWRPPDTSHEVLGYQLDLGEGVFLEVSEPRASLERCDLSGDRVSVSALYLVEGELIAGDPSPELTLTQPCPELLQLSPATGYQGDLLRWSLETRSLRLLQGDVEVDLGEGVRVQSVEVLSVDRAEISAQIEEDAALGWRSLRVRSGRYQLREEAAFEVLAGESRPHLDALQPDSLYQGDQETLYLRASEPWTRPPELSIEGELVLGETSWQGDELWVEVTVSPQAALGPRTLWVDDGERLLSGSLEIRDAPAPSSGRCAAGSGLGGGLAALLAALVGLRRRRPAGAGRPG